ncbi:DinB family protein [Granulicella cerasi]|uniref:DinB family protein n=1 Tax=Granulicella cerasi TaxID=741063 RepID=A0ABW1ZD65_9BACT|nr:DinB family protein [Granulicella cerasi]
MSQPTAWFERKFAFPLSIEVYPSVVERLSSAADRLAEEVSSVGTSLMKKPQGRWSIKEHVGHLGDIEPLWLARVEDYVQGRQQLTPTDLQNKQTDEANHNASEITDLLERFRARRMLLLHRLETLHPRQITAMVEHPRMKLPMGIVDHLYFVAEHEDHHLAVIRAMRASPK